MIEVERNDLEKLLQMAEIYLVHLYIEGIEKKEDDLIKKIRFFLKEEEENENEV